MKHRYIIETPDADYECDDYKLNPTIGITCIRIDDEKNETEIFTIYAPVTAIHDFDPKIKTLKAFRAIKNKEQKAAHEQMAEMQRQDLQNNTPKPQDQSPDPNFQ